MVLLQNNRSDLRHLPDRNVHLLVLKTTKEKLLRRKRSTTKRLKKQRKKTKGEQPKKLPAFFI